MNEHTGRDNMAGLCGTLAACAPLHNQNDMERYQRGWGASATEIAKTVATCRRPHQPHPLQQPHPGHIFN